MCVNIVKGTRWESRHVESSRRNFCMGVYLSIERDLQAIFHRDESGRLFI